MLEHIIVSWLVSALALWLVAQLIPGIEIRGFGAALAATVVIAIVNATVGVGAQVPALSDHDTDLGVVPAGAERVAC